MISGEGLLAAPTWRCSTRRRHHIRPAFEDLKQLLKLLAGESDRSPGACVGEAIASALLANPPARPPQLLRDFFRREQNRQSGGAITCSHAIPLCFAVCGVVVSIRVISGGHGCAGHIHVLGSSPGLARASPARAMRAAGCCGSTEETEERKKSRDS